MKDAEHFSENFNTTSGAATGAPADAILFREELDRLAQLFVCGGKLGM
jgi:hypothetical protein